MVLSDYQKKRIKDYYIKKSNEEKRREYIKQYYINKAKENRRQENIKKYYVDKKKNHGEKKVKEHYNKDATNNRILNEYIKIRSQGTIYKIATNLANRINQTMKKAGCHRTFVYNDLLGCSIDDFAVHLFLLMEDGMTFDNYGEWEIDHIIPISHFDFTKIDHIKRCCHVSNLQPLWLHDNRHKSNKI